MGKYVTVDRADLAFRAGETLPDPPEDVCQEVMPTIAAVPARPETWPAAPRDATVPADQ